MVGRVIVWLNGIFRAGKTTTAKALTSVLPNARIFDSEHVGYLLRHVLATETAIDFQFDRLVGAVGHQHHGAGHELFACLTGHAASVIRVGSP